jgi:DNA polymerase-1
MAMAGAAPAPAPAPALLRRCPCSAPPWAPAPFRPRRRGRSTVSPFTVGRRYVVPIHCLEVLLMLVKVMK